MKLSLSKKQGKLINEAIEHWSNEQIIDNETRRKIEDSMEIRAFEWKSIAIYSFWFSIIFLIVAFIAVFADDILLKLIAKIFSASSTILSALFATAAVLFFWWGFKKDTQHLKKHVSAEFIVLLGAVSTVASVYYFGEATNLNTGNYPILLLIATLIYFSVGVFLPSKMLVIIASISLGCWFGACTDYYSNNNQLFWGMNYPLRFTLFGMAFTLLSCFFVGKRLNNFRQIIFTIGLLYLLVAVWLLSIFGNYTDFIAWGKVKQISMIGWGALSYLIAIAVTLYGFKNKDLTSKGFGISFLLLNLYTKYFEYCWNYMHKAIFFLFLAISFWLIGKNAERIWNLGFIRTKELDEED